MGSTTTFPGDVVIPGALRVTGGITPALARTSILAQSTLQAFTIPLTQWRVWDALHTNLPGTAAADDLALVGGTFATASPTIQSVDFGETTTTAYARTQIVLPWEYEAGQSVSLRFHGGMLVIADANCTLDIACYKTDEEGDISADLASAAVSDNINSAVFADIDFTITSAALTPGDTLDVRMSITGTDAATAAANVTAVIGATQLLCDVR